MFQHCDTLEKTKKLFKKLALRLHPDVGGDVELMILLKEAYDFHLQGINGNNDGPEFSASDDWLYIDDERMNILEELYGYARKNKKFDTEFLESVKDYLVVHGRISLNQYNALLRIYRAFKVDKTKEKMYAQR